MTQPTDWMAEERGFYGALQDFNRLRRRAATRPLLTLGLTFLVTMALVIRTARKPPTYESDVTFRVVESELEFKTASRPNKALRTFIMDVVFSNALLIDLMKRYHLGGTRFNVSPIDAADAMRIEDIEVNVWRNYFLDIRSVNDPARSARLSIEFAHPDPQVAFEVVSELANAITEESDRTGKAAAQRALTQYEEDVLAARAEVVDSETRLALDEVKMLRATPPERAALSVDESRLRALLVGQDAQLEDYERRRDDYRLRVAMEGHQLGTQFEVIEAPRPARAKTDRPQRLALFGLVLFILLLPLVAMGVGAYDSRVYDSDDLRRLGVEPLGHVPGFSGDEVGSLDQRLQRATSARPPSTPSTPV